MKQCTCRPRLLAAVAVFQFLLVGLAGPVQTNYTLDWFAVDGGAGMSTGSVYAVTGRIGQPDAGKSSGARYGIEGGFWGVLSAVQVQGEPLLSLKLTATNTVIVSWPSLSSNWRLQESADPGTTSWKDVTTQPQQVGGRKQVLISPPAGNRFYRLFKQ